MLKVNYTDNQLMNTIRQSTSMRQTLFNLGFKADSSHAYNRVRLDILRLSLDTSHFYTYSKLYSVKYNNDELVFCIDSDASLATIKRYFKTRSLYKCNICDNLGKWLDKSLVLHLDHINGNNKDNRLQNLRWLCPNCHSQTETYCRSNK